MKITDFGQPPVYFAGTASSANSIGGVSISGSATSNYVLTAVSSNTAVWSPPSGGTSSLYELNNEGGQSVENPLGSVSGAVAVDPSDGNVITLTMTGNTTATLSAPAGSGASTLEWWVTQGGSGGYTLTIAATAGTVTDDGTLSPDTTFGVTVRYITDKVPATTNDWIRSLVGGSSSTTTTSTSSGHQHTVGDPFTADGLSATYYLSNYPDDATVAAYINGVRTDVTQVLDAVTFSGIPVAGAALRFDYVLETT